MGYFDKISALGAERTGIVGWQAYRSEAVEGGVLVDGAVAHPKTRGKYAGQPNWRKRDWKTHRRLFFSVAELKNV